MAQRLIVPVSLTLPCIIAFASSFCFLKSHSQSMKAVHRSTLNSFLRQLTLVLILHNSWEKQLCDYIFFKSLVSTHIIVLH